MTPKKAMNYKVNKRIMAYGKESESREKRQGSKSYTKREHGIAIL
jgi:hypothetical protein